MFDQKLAELSNLLDDDSTQIRTLLTKAAQLAEVAGKKEDMLLFRKHYRGMNSVEQAGILETHPTVYNRFFEDRKQTTAETSLVASIEILFAQYNGLVKDEEKAREDIVSAKERLSLNPALRNVDVSVKSRLVGLARTNRMNIQDILSRIRYRIADLYIRSSPRIINQVRCRERK